MVNFRFIAVIISTTLIFLIGIFLGQTISYYNLYELKYSQENILSDMIGYELSYSFLPKKNLCNVSFKEFLNERENLGELVGSLESKLGPKNPEVLLEKERYHLHQIREYLFFKDLKKYCNSSYPLILYFYSHPCDECIAQGYILNTLSRKYNITTIYAIDYDIDNPVIKLTKKLYNITSTPSLIINEKAYSGLIKLPELEKICYE